MHILYIHQYFTTPEEGGGTRSYEFARRLVKKGHKVTMITGTKLKKKSRKNTNRSESYEYIEGISVVYVKTLYSNNMSFRKRLYSFLDFSIRAIFTGIKIKGYDLIFATSTPLTVAIPGIILSTLRKVPMVFEVRDLWPEVPIQMGVIKNNLLIKYLRWFEFYVYKKSNHIIALSPGMVENILHTGVPRNKLSLIPNCCDLDFFKPGDPDLSTLLKLSLPEAPFIVYSGAISYANDIEIIIDAAEELQRIGNKILFIIAGDGKLKMPLEEIARNKDLKNIIFLGKINKYEVAELYKKALACLVIFKNIPILSTNSPNKFFDAISAGKPIITNMGGWIGKLVEKYKIGFSTEPNEMKAFVEGIKKLSSMSKDEIKNMEKNARKLAEEEFNRDKMFGMLENVFQKVKNKQT